MTNNLANLMALTFFHTCTIKRHVMVTQDGLSSQQLTTLAENVPCAVSGGAGSPGIKDEAYIPIEYSDVLYTAPEVDIKAGDVIEANIYGQIETFTAGAGRIYPSHRQTPITKRGRA